jgi:hypothetical protein
VLSEPLVKRIIIPYKQEDVVVPTSMNDPFKDLQAAVDGEIPEKYRDIIFDADPTKLRPNPTLGDVLNVTLE